MPEDAQIAAILEESKSIDMSGAWFSEFVGRHKHVCMVVALTPEAYRGGNRGA